jgi:hypothetical protein
VLYNAVAATSGVRLHLVFEGIRLPIEAIGEVHHDNRMAGNGKYV